MTETAVAPEAAPDAPAPETGGEAAPAVAPEATPATVTEPAAVVQDPVTPPAEDLPGPVDKRSARRGMRDSAKSRVDQVKAAIEGRAPESAPETPATETPAEESTKGKVDANDRTHAPPGKPEGGQFVAEDGKEAAPETPTEPVTTLAPDAPTAVTPPADQPAEAATERQPTFRVELGPDHALAEGMSGTAIETASEDQANAVKALLNSRYVRRQEVIDLEAELFKRDQTIARMESKSTAREKWQSTPEYQKAEETFHAIKEEQGDEAASLYWQGIQVDLDKMADAEYQTRMETVETDRQNRAGNQWREEALRNTQGLPPAIRNIPEFSSWFTSALESFNAELAMGHYPEVKDNETMHAKFSTIFGQRLVQQPAVKAIYAGNKVARDKAAAAKSVGAEQAKRDSEVAAAAAVKEFKEGVAESRIDAPPNPLGNLGPGTAGAAATGEPPPDGQPATADMSAHDLKKSMRRGARTDAERHFGATR